MSRSATEEFLKAVFAYVEAMQRIFERGYAEERENCARLVAAEREACARLVERFWDNGLVERVADDRAVPDAAKIVAAIRARGDA